jgi:hypothetical protein
LRFWIPFANSASFMYSASPSFLSRLAKPYQLFEFSEGAAHDKVNKPLFSLVAPDPVEHSLQRPHRHPKQAPDPNGGNFAALGRRVGGPPTHPKIFTPSFGHRHR